MLAGLRLADVEVLGIASQDEQGNRTEPNVALKTIKSRDLIGASASQRVLLLNQLGISRVLLFAIGGNHINVCKLAILAQGTSMPRIMRGLLGGGRGGRVRSCSPGFATGCSNRALLMRGD